MFVFGHCFSPWCLLWSPNQSLYCSICTNRYAFVPDQSACSYHVFSAMLRIERSPGKTVSAYIPKGSLLSRLVHHLRAIRIVSVSILNCRAQRKECRVLKHAKPISAFELSYFYLLARSSEVLKRKTWLYKNKNYFKPLPMPSYSLCLFY